VRPVLQFGILGPFEVRIDGGAPVALGGLRQRALLAVLGLHANEVVSIDRLVDELWGDNPPPTAVHTVQVFVSRLRSALALAGERLVTRRPGYALEVGVDEIDAGLCERLYGSARSALTTGNAANAAELLNEAQALWRGPPLAEFTYEPFAQATIARLEELRLSCREELIEAGLALGRHAELVSDLEALVREQPFRERPRGQLMLALYRCGRQAEALDAFHQARRMLVEELAVEPSGGLRELEQAILRQDASLEAPMAPPPVDAEPSGQDRPTEGEAPPAPVEGDASISATGGRSEAMVRKTATVLVGLLSTVGRADPEMARSVVALAREQAEEIVARHGGAFVAGLGGELVWVFGLPLVKEDDALRALRAADELRTDLGALSAAGPCQLTVRVGVATGEVIAEAGGDLFGEPLTRGISLTQAAQDGEVLLGDPTRRLASNAVRVEPALEGAAWRLLGLVANALAPVRLGSPMFGRDDELASACGAFARAAHSGETHLLTVVGDAGIGKSRLAQELADQLANEATVLIGRCLSYGEGIAFWPLREALTQAAAGESRDAIRGLLDDAEDADVVADIIATSLGLAPAESVGEQVPWAFRRLLEVIASRRPVMLVIEDGHWAEAPLLDLIDYLVDWLTAPVLLLCLARPELLDVRPGWGGGRGCVRSLVLAPLGEEDTLRLLRHQLGERHLSAGESAQILQTAEGNPLFVEQLLRTTAEDPWWDRESQIPATIQSLLAARLDRLGPGERAFIERAALIGREFWPDAVCELLPAEAQPSAGKHLLTLVHRGLIHPDRSTLAGQEQLRFHHILIRDVAYRGTPKALRSELHERFADWIARRGEQYDEFVGYHLEQAFRYRGELGRNDADALALAARAGDHLAVAGRRAVSRGDLNAAVRLLRSSAQMFEAGMRMRPDVLLDLGTALSESGDFRDAQRVMQIALEQAQATSAEGVCARALIELSYQRALVEPSARVQEMLGVAEDAIAVFKRLGDEGGLARAWLHIAKAHWIRCRCGEMEQALEPALRHAEHSGERRERSRILSDLARATVIGPRPVDEGIRRCHAILESAEDDVGLTAVTETMLAVLEAMAGHFEEARTRWERNKRRLEDLGLSVTLAVLQMYRAFIELLAGSPEDAEPEVTAACTVLEGIGDRDRLATTAVLLARLLYAQGQLDKAERYTRISEEAASEDDVVSGVLWRGTRGKVLVRAGKTRLADELVNTAVALAQETDFLMLHADALADRANVRVALSRPQEAVGDLGSAITLYERKGIRVSAQAARRSYESLASDPAVSVSA
jgi:DNA-binding SARP family transcriptional activator/class 3 adenylate cyclase